MSVDTTWTAPSTMARAAGQTLPYSNYEDLLSNVNRLGGSDGNTKLGTWLINQGTDDTIILSGGSSDVAHGMTDIAPTADFFTVRKMQGSTGGARVTGLSETGQSGRSLVLEGYSADAPPTTPDASSHGVVNVSAGIKSGTAATAVAADGVCFSVDNNGTVLLTVQGDGDLSVNGSGTLGTFDHHLDGKMARAIRALMAPRDSKLRKDHETLVTQYGKAITDAKLVFLDSKRPDAPPKINLTRLGQFSLDALYQMGARLDALEAQLAGQAGGRR